MVPVFPRRLADGVIFGVCAAALWLPSTTRAEEPVEKLRQALTNPRPTSPNAKLNAERSKRVQAAIGELKTISQYRRAYFLTEWSQYFNLFSLEKGKENAVRIEMEGYRAQIGKRLRGAIVKAAQSSETDDLVAVAIMTAELGDTELGSQAKVTKDIFVRGLTDVMVRLTKSADLKVRQAALNALGKIAPDPAIAMPIVRENLASGDLGPQRLAAYALVDLVKKSRFHPAEEMTLFKDVIDAAASGVKAAGEQQPAADEPTRGYCLEAIQEAAVVISAKFSSEQFKQEGADVRKKVTKQQAAVLDALRLANPALVQGLGDSKIHVRLAALAALEQISLARSKIMKSFEGPDPLANIIERDWRAVARLLKNGSPGDTKENRLRLRLGAIAFFEHLAADAAPAEPEIADALRDEDRFVRWAAMRTIGSIDAKKVSSKAINALAFNLLTDIDGDLTGAAADALEAIGPEAREAVPALGIVIVNAGAASRHWDVENREKAMKALVSIGGTAAQNVLPEVLTALGDKDARVRRAAAATLGQLGRPAEADLAQRLINALRRALRDDDAEVRLNASEAILSLAPRKGL